jgi:hypothetical protein
MDSKPKPWSARLAGAPVIIARPGRVKLDRRNRLAAAVFDPGAESLLPVPGSTWILENGVVSITLKTVSIRKGASGGILVLAESRTG